MKEAIEELLSTIQNELDNNSYWQFDRKVVTRTELQNRAGHHRLLLRMEEHRKVFDLVMKVEVADEREGV